MSDNVRFYWQNLFDAAAALSANSTGATDLGVANLQERHFTKPWRSAACAAEWVKWDLGSALVVRAVIVRGHNLTTGATVKIQAHTSDAWTTPALDETVTITQAMIDSNIIPVHFSADQTYRYWRLYIEDAANADGYIELGRLFCGPFSSPLRQASAEYEFGDSGSGASKVKSSDYGQKYVTIVPDYQIFGMAFENFGLTDLALYESMRKALSTVYAFFFCDDPSDLVTRTFYVSCTSGWKFEHVHGGLYYRMELTLEEER